MDVYVIASMFFLMVGILITIRNFWIFNYRFFFWFCDFLTFLLAISFFMGYFQLIKALINIGLIGQILALIYNIPPQIIPIIKGKKNIASENFRIFVEVLVHITLPISIILTYRIVPTFQSLGYSAIILCIMFFMVLIFTPKEENINAVYYLELGRKETGIKKYKLPFHTYFWLLYGFILCLINFSIQYLIYYLTL
jgi:hypothetical protein